MNQHDYSKSPVNGYYNKKYEESISKIASLKNKHESLEHEWVRLLDVCNKNSSLENIKKRDEITNEMSKIEDTIKALEIQTESGIFNLDTSYNNDPYIPSEISYSLGDINGRAFIGRERERMILDHYEETISSTEFVDGEDSPTNFRKLLTTLKLSEEDSVMFDSNIAYNIGAKTDDPETFDQAITHAHTVMMVNAENKKAFEILRSAKDPVSMDKINLQEVINANLCAKAKKEAVILVNHSGFAKIDTVNSNGGYPLVKRDTSGQFIYCDKYPIQEVADEILPNKEDGTSPVIIGDLSIVKFFIMRDDLLEREVVYKFELDDRNLKREIIALSTTSNRAYIHGSI